MLRVLVSSSRHFFRYSHAVLVYSGELLAWRNASTVAQALWVWMGSMQPDSGFEEGIVSDCSCENQQKSDE